LVAGKSKRFLVTRSPPSIAARGSRAHGFAYCPKPNASLAASTGCLRAGSRALLVVMPSPLLVGVHSVAAMLHAVNAPRGFASLDRLTRDTVSAPYAVCDTFRFGPHPVFVARTASGLAPR
jgi:hypothetical protein